LGRWTVTVSGTVCTAADAKQICHYWLALAEASPPLVFKNAGDTRPEYRNRYQHVPANTGKGKSEQTECPFF